MALNFLLFLCDRITLGSTDRPRIHDIGQAGLELAVTLLPHPPVLGL